MKTMNRVLLLGYLGRKPEIVISKRGRPYSRLSVATHRSWSGAMDGKQEQTEWHSVFVWGAQAEYCSAHLDRGSLVLVEGALSYWKVKEKEYRNAIEAHEIRLLHSPPSRAAESLEGRESGSRVDKDALARNHNAVAHLA